MDYIMMVLTAAVLGAGKKLSSAQREEMGEFMIGFWEGWKKNHVPQSEAPYTTAAPVRH